MSLNNAPEGCLGPGEGDKGAFSPTEPPDICQVTLIQRQNVEAAQCKAEWRSLLTGTWRTTKRSESSKGEEAQKGPDNSCSWRKLLRTNAPGPRRNPRGMWWGKTSLLRELCYAYSGSKEPPCAKGFPHLLGLSRTHSFSSVRFGQTSYFLCPRAMSPFCNGQRGRRGLAAVVAALWALAWKYLVNTARSFNFLLH